MFYINRNPELEKITISNLYKIYKLNKIDDTPYYQRYSELWTDEKKRLLIDTIINGYDIPKFYFHYILSVNNQLNSTNKEYAIIDGKQRLNALVSFLEGEFELDESVKYLKNPNLSFKKACSENSPGRARRIPSSCKIRFSNKSNTTCPPWPCNSNTSSPVKEFGDLK